MLRIPVANRPSRIKKPKGSMRANCHAQGPGNKPTATLPPSSGGKGSKLRIINTALICMPNTPIYCMGSPAQEVGPKIIPILATNAQNTAISKFAAGPAAATIAMSRLG